MVHTPLRGRRRVPGDEWAIVGTPILEELRGEGVRVRYTESVAIETAGRRLEDGVLAITVGRDRETRYGEESHWSLADWTRSDLFRRLPQATQEEIRALFRGWKEANEAAEKARLEELYNQPQAAQCTRNRSNSFKIETGFGQEDVEGWWYLSAEDRGVFELSTVQDALSEGDRFQVVACGGGGHWHLAPGEAARLVGRS